MFVPEGQRRRAYADSALPIGSGQTISQPWIVAAICQALELHGAERVLEIGTGSGYSAAVLARLAAEVMTIERHAELAQEAAARLQELGVSNGERGDRRRQPRPAGGGRQSEAIVVHAMAPEPPISSDRAAGS